MSIQNEIDRITSNVAETFSAVSEKGGIVPEEANSDNLPDAVRSIPVDQSVQTYLINAPIGSIIAWSGTEDDVPEGWHICDGTEGTKDLRGKFILGATTEIDDEGNTAHSIGETGGEETHKLTGPEMPKHGHGTTQTGYAGDQAIVLTNEIGVGSKYGSFSNSTSSSAKLVTTKNLHLDGNSQPHNNMPPYYALLFIQKISETPTDYVTREEVEEMTGLPVRPVTQEEYDALSEEEKNGETAWLVTDAEGNGSSGGGDGGQTSSAGEVYSTEETRIGTWIDGKPLYRRCFLLNNENLDELGRYTVPNTLDFIQNISIINTDGKLTTSVINIRPGGAWLNLGGVFSSRVYVNNSVGVKLEIIYFKISGSQSADSSWFSPVSGWFSIEYTKTTD